MRREGREPLPDHAGESPLLSRSGGEKGLRGSGAGTLGVPLEGTRRVGGLLVVAGRLSGPFPPSGRNRGLPLRRRGGQGPHLAKRWEPRGFSRRDFPGGPVARTLSSQQGIRSHKPQLRPSTAM